MSELPPPDLKDQQGRASRLVLALLVGAACAAVAYAACGRLTAGAHDNPYDWIGGPTELMGWGTGMGGVLGFVVTLAIANWRAKKKWRESLVAKAQVKR
jgi:hypothetical protein